jgi:hypothetical protein|nr:MAG TPA: hypothetical protein [Caudoviricetes sp.]
MTGIKIVNLGSLIENVGEERAKAILSNFSCPLNADVEHFLKTNAILFAKQGLAATHLVFKKYKKEPVLVGYFSLASKYITVSKNKVTSTTARRIAKFAAYNQYSNVYSLSAPLIAQLGKNFTNGYNELITGDELLALAIEKVQRVQMDVGGRISYVECEDKPALIDFYSRNGFREFDKRTLDKDETDLQGEYLVQLLRYISLK